MCPSPEDSASRAAARRSTSKSTQRPGRVGSAGSTAATDSATPAGPLGASEPDVQLRLFSEDGRRGW